MPKRAYIAVENKEQACALLQWSKKYGKEVSVVNEQNLLNIVTANLYYAYLIQAEKEIGVKFKNIAIQCCHKPGVVFTAIRIGFKNIIFQSAQHQIQEKIKNLLQSKNLYENFDECHIVNFIEWKHKNKE